MCILSALSTFLVDMCCVRENHTQNLKPKAMSFTDSTVCNMGLAYSCFFPCLSTSSCEPLFKSHLGPEQVVWVGFSVPMSPCPIWLHRFFPFGGFLRNQKLNISCPIPQGFFPGPLAPSKKTNKHSWSIWLCTLVIYWHLHVLKGLEFLYEGEKVFHIILPLTFLLRYFFHYSL